MRVRLLVQRRQGRGDEAARKKAVDDVVAAAIGLGLAHAGTITSPIEGADGNVEFLCWFRRDARG